MRFLTAMMGFLLLGSWTAWGQEVKNRASEVKKEPIFDPIYQARIPPGLLSRQGKGSGSMKVQGGVLSPTTPPAVYPLIFSGSAAAHVLMTHSGDIYADGIMLNKGLIGGPQPKTTIFSVPFNIAPESTYVDVMFVCNLILYPGADVKPGSTGLGATIDCRVEQDLDGSNNFATVYHCSGISDSLKPWLAFNPSSDYTGSTYMGQFRGYAPVTSPIMTSGPNVGLPTPTRVVVDLYGIEWDNSMSGNGEVWAFNRTLKILY